ncbi:hypothetical protein NQZ68_022090 [Dissostichus eleginoides]|nr:hypothetical protein NQZ68_022090 [Dissostichus eleginoides]
MMTFNRDFLPIHRTNQLVKSVCEMSSWCWPATEIVLSASRGWLRRFLLLKLVTVLLFPHAAGLPLLAGSVFSLRALLLLRSPHISTKPSTVLLGRLALTDSLVLLHWTLRLGATLETWWTEETKIREEGWWREAVGVLCQQLLDAHHLASLLLLGLLDWRPRWCLAGPCRPAGSGRLTGLSSAAAWSGRWYCWKCCTRSTQNFCRTLDLKRISPQNRTPKVFLWAWCFFPAFPVSPPA